MVGFVSRRWLVAACLLAAAACARYEESGLPGSAASLARNKMMWVREEPSTFGHYRLATLAAAHPDLEAFIKSRGQPDFLAETYHERYEYLILYYLDRRRAYACKIRHDHPRDVEFEGPYGITRKEYQLLDGFRKQSE